MSADFEQSVLASRLNSWQRKSNLRPTGLSGRRRQAGCALGDVGGKPVQLLAHVGLAHQQRHFGRSALQRRRALQEVGELASKRERTVPICAWARSAARLHSPSISRYDRRSRRPAPALGGTGSHQGLQHLVERRVSALSRAAIALRFLASSSSR